MPVTVNIVYLKDELPIKTPADFPNRVTIEASTWKEVTTEAVKEALVLRLAYHELKPEEIQFMYMEAFVE